MKSLQELKDLFKPENEAAAWKIIQGWRQSFGLNLFRRVRVSYQEEALASGIAIIRDIRAALESLGLDLKQIEPGHSVGHIVRDYVHSLMLVSKDQGISNSYLLVGLVAGTFHDVGCALVPRYQESQRAVRHAEAGAILLWEILQDALFSGPGRPEPLLIAWAVAAHTHYLKPAQIECKDGIIRCVEPYPDEVGAVRFSIDGIWLPRWADRLDCNGPAFVGRHFLTLVEPHKDFGHDQKHYLVEFASHMRPLLRSNQERGDEPRTMLERLAMFANSQTKESPYGRYDFGVMVELRDRQTARLRRIIEAVQQGGGLTKEQRDKILWAWAMFLQKNIEPTDLGAKVVKRLEAMFRGLNDDVQTVWCRGFRTTMEEYQGWTEDTLRFLETVDPSWLNFSPIVDDVREIIRPHPEWVKLFK